MKCGVIAALWGTESGGKEKLLAHTVDFPSIHLELVCCEKLWLFLLLHSSYLAGAMGPEKKIMKDHFVSKDDVLHT